MSFARAALVFVTLVTATACVTPLPPYTLAAPRVPAAAPTRSKVVFLWETTRCEPGGYYTVATGAGRFVGNLYSDTRLETDVEPGDTTFVAWNPEMEKATGQVGAANVALAHAKLEAGRTYFLQFSFGTWDERGPRGPLHVTYRRGGGGTTVCRSSDASLVALTPASQDWASLAGWLDELRPLTGDPRLGQAWLDEDPAVLPDHVAWARSRFLRMRPDAKALATLTPQSGVRVVPH